MRRYAIFYAPEPGDFAVAGAIWLGRDAVIGRWVPQIAVPGLRGTLHDLTAAPRRYGFHGTLRPPFRLAEGQDEAALAAAVEALAARLAPVMLDGLTLARMGRFLAFAPRGTTEAVDRLAATLVRELDPFRAPPTAGETARRDPAALTPAQRAHLDRWGHPFVMEEFRFHLTLTGEVTDAEAAILRPAAERHFAGTVPHPVRIASLCLFGEDDAGLFHLVRRVPLRGTRGQVHPGAAG